MSYQLNFKIDKELAEAIKRNSEHYGLPQGAYCRMVLMLFVEGGYDIGIKSKLDNTQELYSKFKDEEKYEMLKKISMIELDREMEIRASGLYGSK